MPQFPSTRLRRLRQHAWLRDLVAETQLSVKDLIWPLFVVPGQNIEQSVDSLPGVSRWSVDGIVAQAERAVEHGIPAIALFPATPPELKTEDGREALNPNNLVCTAVQAVREKLGDQLGILCDVALDPYTSHGQDGLLKNGVILNDESVEVLCQQAVVQAQAGCTVIAPSDMMDGRIGAIRGALDAAGFDQVLILSYAAKYASAFYGPFRDAVGSSGNLGSGDKKTYQMNPANSQEAIREATLDIEEGADILMVKPGMPYLDILSRLKQELAAPMAVYQVSGEYAMLCAAAENGWLQREDVILESLLSFKRAGADMILSYFALDAAQALHCG